VIVLETREIYVVFICRFSVLESGARSSLLDPRLYDWRSTRRRTPGRPRPWTLYIFHIQGSMSRPSIALYDQLICLSLSMYATPASSMPPSPSSVTEQSMTWGRVRGAMDPQLFGWGHNVFRPPSQYLALEFHILVLN